MSKVRNELKQLYLSDKCMPLMVRLAWHDAGTYSKARPVRFFLSAAFFCRRAVGQEWRRASLHPLPA